MNHKWPPKDEWNVILSQECRDGNEQIIRQCMVCNIIKITVIPPLASEAWHEWVTNSGMSWVGESTPPCIPKGKIEEVRPDVA